jgi:hypothetical protein
MEESLRYIFISRGTPTYENVYRPQKVDSGERKPITAKLLSGKCYIKICYIFYVYIYSSSRNRGIYIPRFLEEPLTMVCGTPGFLGTLVGKHCLSHCCVRKTLQILKISLSSLSIRHSKTPAGLLALTGRALTDQQLSTLILCVCFC